MITLEQGIELVWTAFKDMIGGETYIKKIPSMNIMDIAKVVAPDAKKKIIGIRPGEKLHEQMVSIEDAPNTYEYQKYYKVLPVINDWAYSELRIKEGKKVRDNFFYSSEANDEWMSAETLKQWIEDNISKIGLI